MKQRTHSYRNPASHCGRRVTGRVASSVKAKFLRTPARLARSLSLVGVLITGCTDAHVTAPLAEVTRAELLKAMTPEAATTVDKNGRIQFPAVANTGRAQISGGQAGALAVAVAKYNMPYLSEVWDGQHGGPIAYQKLATCGDPVYAASPFERLPNDDPSLPAHHLQKGLGPFWLVRLCGPAGDPQVNVAVAAYSTELGITSGGAVDFPAIGGGDFGFEGIPKQALVDELPTAEAAVVLAARITGRLVAAAPELITPFFKDDSPFGSRWRIRLDGKARLKNSAGEFMEASELFIGRVRTTKAVPSSRAWTADGRQPSDVEVTFIPQARVGENIKDYTLRQQLETRVIRVPRLPGTPISFSAALPY